MRPLHILHVEDSEGDILLLRDAIKDSGIVSTLDVVKNGVEALQFLHKEDKYKLAETPDLILMDINMPLMNGHEVLDNIKKDDKLKHIPIVMLTTSTAKSDILKSYQKYASSYIVKPNDSEDFDNVIKDIQNFWLNVAELPVNPSASK